ncbi:LysR family transcriptional regulator [Modestobacter altitudinis]|uniref:LysR family transcriptional regulator n=1 Tax=Modestobacter altitudinis TaxID=2213158 RepID=UPI00110D198D|nr:LysR family transcriptional regulator [Modestobacter altitudinis]
MSGVRGIDFNLLVALRALLEERNVTRAGLAVNMSQPAMSAALARLREHYGDELLERTGRTYELTTLAQELLPQVSHALDAVTTALEPWAGFDPSTSTRRFTVSGSDYALAVLLEPLMTVVHRRAPGITVDFDPVPLPGSDVDAHLLRRDVLIAAMGYAFPGRRQVVFSDRFVCIVAGSNPRLRDGRLTREDLAELPYAAAFGGQLQTPADATLLEAGITPRVEVSVQGLLALPFAVSGTDLCAFVPERLLDRCPPTLDLAVADLPLDDPELAEAAHWHPSRQDDPSVRWLREVLKEVSAALGHGFATA